MNKHQEYQEALDNICCGCYGGDDGCNGKDKYCSRYLRLQELVDKEIPKKVKHSSCPNCGRMYLIKNANYCPHCGQRLDWREENE